VIVTAASAADLLIAKLAVGGLLVVLFWRFLVWVRDAPIKPDPWDAETAKKLSDPDTSQACHHCSTPLTTTAWFCPHCGSAVGPYNNMMPYVMIFSEGEVYRNGLDQRFRNRSLVGAGYLLLVTAVLLKIISSFNSLLGILLGVVVALIYSIRIFKNLRGSPPPETN